MKFLPLITLILLSGLAAHALEGHVRTARFAREHEFYERCVQKRCVDGFAQNASLETGRLEPSLEHAFHDCILECSQRAIDAHVFLPDSPLITCYRRGQPCNLASQCANGDDGYYACSIPPNCPFCTSKVCSLGGTQSWTPGVCPMRGYRCNNPTQSYYPAYDCSQATDGYSACANLAFNVGSAPGSVCVSCSSCTA